MTLVRQHCCYYDCITVAITVRKVPEPVRDELATRAARSGRSLQEYLLNHLVEVVSLPSVEEVVQRARQRSELTGTLLDATAIVADRDAERR